MITKKFGRNVRKVRAIRGLSQEQLATLSGLHRTYIGFVERGERNITLMNAQRIAIALGLTLAELIETCNDKQR